MPIRVKLHAAGSFFRPLLMQSTAARMFSPETRPSLARQSIINHETQGRVLCLCCYKYTHERSSRSPSQVLTLAVPPSLSLCLPLSNSAPLLLLGPEPHWHVELEATYHPDGTGRCDFKNNNNNNNNNNRGLPGRFSRGATTPWPTSSGRHHAHLGGGPSSSNPNRRDATKRRGGVGGGGGGGGGGGDKKQKNTKAQKKRAKLKRDAEEIEMRKRKKKRGSPNAQAATTTAGAKLKKRKAGGASSGHDAAGSAKTGPLRKKTRLSSL